MLGWKIKKLSDVTTKIGSGSTPRGGKGAYKEEGISLIRSLNIHDKKFLKKDLAFIDDSQAEKLKNVIVEENDVLLNITGASVCRCSIVPDFVLPARVNQHVAILRSEPEFLDSKYLELCLTSEDYKRRLLHIATSGGATREALTKEQLENFEIPLPPLAEQRRIAAILDKADAIRRKQQQAIDLCDQFLKALFIDMFGDPVTNPKGWEVKNLEELCEKIVDCPHSTPKHLDEISKFASIRTSEIKNGYIDWSKMKYVSEEEYEKRNKRLVPVAGDIVYAREGSFGEAVILPDAPKICLGQRVMLFRADLEKCNNVFLWSMVRSNYVYRQALRKNCGSTVGHVNVGDIKKFKLLLPPLDLQNKFAEIVKKTEAKKAKMQKSLKRLNDSFNALSQKAFKGEL